MELVLLIGIQGAGKTTFSQQRLLHSHLRLSLDVLRTRRREGILFQACLTAGQPVVIDNTNVTAAERARFIAPARAAHFRITGYFFEPDPQASLARNQRRTGRHHVPPAGLLSTLKRLERPRHEEGFDALWRVWNEEERGFRCEAWE